MLEKEPQQAKITYLVNEKLNAIAPKITKKWASALQTEVDTTFSELVNKTIFLYFNKLWTQIQAGKPLFKKIADMFSGANYVIDKTYANISQVKSDAADMNVLLYNARNDIPTIKKWISSANAILDDSDYLISYSRERLDTIPQLIESEFNSVSATVQSIDSLLTKQIALVSAVGDYADINFSWIQLSLSSAQQKTTLLLSVLQEINLVSSWALDPIVSQLSSLSSSMTQQLTMISSIQSSLAEGKQLAKTSLNQLDTGISKLNASAKKINSNFHTNISPLLEDSLNNLEVISDDTRSILDKASRDLPTVERILNNTISWLSLSIDAMSRLESKLPDIQNGISTINKKISSLQNNKDLQQLNESLSFDPVSHSQFIANPVYLEEKKLFPIPNYWSAMSPFFTTLSLWVGVLLIVSLFSTEPKRLLSTTELSASEKFFGRYLLFVSIAVFQALFVSLWDFFVLGTYVSNLPVFVLVSVFTSLVFCGIVFSLVSVFWNIWKVLSIIFLVLQLSGSGWTFPIEVTPAFFQFLHPLLPFTYAISAMRESVGWIVSFVFWKDILILWVLFVFIMILWVCIKSYVNKYIHIIERSLHESGLSVHE